MPRATRAYKKRKGFNFSGRKSNEIVIEGSTAAIPAPLVEAPVSSSSKKLGDLNSSYSGVHDAVLAFNEGCVTAVKFCKPWGSLQENTACSHEKHRYRAIEKRQKSLPSSYQRSKEQT
ncbi:hypothetical protein JTE90_002953 [Oedothorax gibbosus]|uniref:Uncharacterized protein n=1 Tax=Oedothorax gibbosus TaxID=931172 RepID=A0AAV6TM74_9ARAC|nr:hypothetical protein JTE90_002953 [Oedothorax gibbosus]